MPASRIVSDGLFGSGIKLYLPDGITQVRQAMIAMIPNNTAKAESILICLRLRFGRLDFFAFAVASAFILSTIYFPSLGLIAF